jgi:hypothetical protein
LSESAAEDEVDEDLRDGHALEANRAARVVFRVEWDLVPLNGVQWDGWISERPCGIDPMGKSEIMNGTREVVVEGSPERCVRRSDSVTSPESASCGCAKDVTCF